MAAQGSWGEEGHLPSVPSARSPLETALRQPGTPLLAGQRLWREEQWALEPSDALLSAQVSHWLPWAEPCHVPL